MIDLPWMVLVHGKPGSRFREIKLPDDGTEAAGRPRVRILKFKNPDLIG